jgi:streptogramin lyase
MQPRAIAIVLVLAAPAAAQGRLFAVQSSPAVQQLVRIDETTAAGTTVGPLGFLCDGLAYSPDGRLLAADNTQRQLVQLDPLTAGSTAVGSFDFGSNTMEGMTAHPLTGELWGINVSTDELVRIDGLTGAASVVGGFGGPASLAGLAWSRDGATLFAADHLTGGLFTLDPASGIATLVGVGGAGTSGGPLGLAADPLTGELYVAEWRGGVDMTLATVDPGTGARTPVGVLVGYSQIEGLSFEGGAGGGLGARYCSPAVPNSTGAPASLVAFGSAVASDDLLTLVATGLPANQLGYFLASRSQGFVPGAGGSQGNLCLALPIARFAQQLGSSGAGGWFSIQVDLTAIPTTPASAVVAGDTWSFQAWYRDANPGQTSNFTDGVAVTFL